MNFKNFIKPTKGKIILFLVFFIVLIFIAFTAICDKGGGGCNLSAKIANIIFPILAPFSYFGTNILLLLNLIYWYLLSCLIVYIYNKRTEIKLKNIKKFFLNFVIRIKHLKINKKVLVFLLIITIFIASLIVIKKTTYELKNINELRDEYYFNLAKETNDISFCEKIKWFVEDCGGCPERCYNISKRDLCFREVAINSLNPEICEKATTSECFWTAEGCFCSEVLIKDMCYKEIAIKLKNISLCQKISDIWHKKGCTSASKLQSIERSIIVKKAGGVGLLIAECANKTHIKENSDYIIEGIVEQVESKWNEEKTSIFTYTDLSIGKYVKGVPFETDKMEIITDGGCVDEICQAVEDTPIFHEGKNVRIYFEKINEDFFIVCGQFGVEEILYTDESLSLRSMKGWELYSWEENGSWHFSLVGGTNRIKTCEEVTSKDVSKDISDLKRKLRWLAKEESIFWVDRAPQNCKNFGFPPTEIVGEIKDYTEEIGLHLELVE